MYKNFENVIKYPSSEAISNVINGHRPVNQDYRNRLCVTSSDDGVEVSVRSGDDWCWKRLLTTCCKPFKYPSPEAYASTSPARGEVKT